MNDRVRPYLFYDVAISICSRCFRKVEGKIVFRDGKVLMLKRCPEHGSETVMMADDVDYYRKCREVFLKPPEQAAVYNTPVRWGCPYDCGLCPDHEQHSCLSLVEITDHCNLRCPTCYSASGPERQNYRTLEHVERMLDAVVRNEQQPDIVQISGGEPTMHPDFFAILDAAKRRPIRHLMVNTNGLRHRRRRRVRPTARRLHARLRNLPAVRFAERRTAECLARRRPAQRAPACSRTPEPAGHLHHAGRHPAARTQR